MAKQQGWIVRDRSGHQLDTTVFFDVDMDEDAVKRALEHDGYTDISVWLYYPDSERLDRAIETLAEWRLAMEHLADALRSTAESLRHNPLADAIEGASETVRLMSGRPPITEADLRTLAGDRDARTVEYVNKLFGRADHAQTEEDHC